MQQKFLLELAEDVRVLWWDVGSFNDRHWKDEGGAWLQVIWQLQFLCSIDRRPAGIHLVCNK